MSFQDHDLLVVGAGFFGLTVAHQAASRLGLKVLVIERRNHIGGNAHSEVDPETGIEVHTYGSHLFHCNAPQVWRYLNGFTSFTDYRHHVWARHKDKLYPMPISLATICSFFDKAYSPEQARSLISSQAQSGPSGIWLNLEDKAISLIGQPLYEAFIRGYTAKQWQTDPKLLPPSIITRLPVRYNLNTRYFDDRYEGLPSEGYHTIFKRMTADPSIAIMLNTDYFDIRDKLKKGIPTIYTGPIDRYFDNKLGELSWRTLDFEKSVMPVGDFQGASVVNYSDEDVPYTRIHEFRHLHPERKYPENKTVIFKEYSRFAKSGDEPYYPIRTSEDNKLFSKYQKLAELENNVIFGGRLGTYRYLDMHQAIGAALKVFNFHLEPYFRHKKPLSPSLVDDMIV